MAKRGRKVSLPWKKVKAIEWKNLSDKDVAERVGCSVPMANVKRNALRKDAEARGKNPEFFTWRHGRKRPASQ